ncbi:hypothetical protein [Petrachloros mirabilis]
MSDIQSFWPVPHRKDEPAFWVCMSCLAEVFYRKVPMPDCPSCHGVSTYEAFTIEAISDWGTEDLIAKANAAQQAANVEPAPASSVESAS